MRTNEHIQPIYVQFKHPYNPVRHFCPCLCVHLLGYAGNMCHVHVSTYPTLSLLQKRKRIFIIQKLYVYCFNKLCTGFHLWSWFKKHPFDRPLSPSQSAGKDEAIPPNMNHSLKPWISKMIHSRLLQGIVLHEDEGILVVCSYNSGFLFHLMQPDLICCISHISNETATNSKNAWSQKQGKGAKWSQTRFVG